MRGGHQPGFLMPTQGSVLTAIKSILLFCPRAVGHLDARPPLICILEEIDIRALVKAVVWRIVGRRAVEVMHVSEA